VTDGPVAGGLRYRAWLEGLLGVPLTDGNQIDVLRNGDQILPAMLEGIHSASTSVDLCTFIFRGGVAGDFAAALADRARAGVRVRVLLDALGTGEGSRQAIATMRAAGAQVELFRPLLNRRVWESFHRAHRKVVVVDHDLAFTGGVGLADEWRGDARTPAEWRDTHFRVRGPAVDGLLGAFVHNWAATGRPLYEEGVDRFPEAPQPGRSALQVVRAGAGTGWRQTSTLVCCLIGLARSRVRVAAAYFVPDEYMLDLLCATAARGVAVEVLVNGAHGDKPLNRLASEAHYERLLEAGVRLFCFAPTMMHLKIMTVDGQVASVGSSNFNPRSFMLDEEVNVVVVDPAVVAVLDGHYDEDLARSLPVELSRWRERSRRQKALEAVPGFVARQL
jgi:cardiolipin synthase